MLSYLLFTIAIAGTLGSTVFLGLALVGAWRFQRDLWREAKRPAPDAPPPVSVLKPVHGMEPSLRETLESYFRQDHPEYELLFCARRRNDPALAVVDELCREYPQVNVRVLTCGEPPYPNAKVHSVATMIAAARHDILILSDSDVRAHSDYVREISRPLVDPKVGVVTCIYRGMPVGSLWSLLEALGFTVEMSSGVLIARMLEGMRFALGPTLATRKDVLAAIGGYEQFGEYCAEDFLIGNRAAKAGYEVVLSGHVIDHQAGDATFLKSFDHQIRWMRSTRFSRPKGHFGTGITFAMPFGVLGFIAGIMAGAPLAGAALLSWAYWNRVILAVAIGWGVLRDLNALLFCWLYPARDLMGFFVWMGSYLSDKVVWRGQRYRLLAEGKMTRVE
ncbi:MAG: bacteriohopanetetrol glucosamine biosynthesis glycosyltransferase HpnI [Acidobacteriales bacterium]|nr:bacteriohopanetetrol glucosamine biosynthesis glycosyltransferase HpnI [Terriglobales bacterium]